MGQRIRSSLARCLALAVVLGGCGHAAISESLGTSVAAAGHSQQAELTVSGASDDFFGFSVALSASGTTALAGAPFRHSSTGAAYVFAVRGGSWSQIEASTVSGDCPRRQRRMSYGS